MTCYSPLTRCFLSSSHVSRFISTRQSLPLCLKLLFSGYENCLLSQGELFVNQSESPALLPAPPARLKPAAAN